MASTDAVSEAQRSRRTNWNNQIARHAQMIPDRTALRFLGDSITWGTLDARVEKLADALARRGVSFGDRVLILMLNRPEYLEVVLATNALGAIAVPVNFRLTPPEVAYLVNDSGSKVIVAEGPLAPLAGAARAASEGIDISITVGAPAEGDSLNYEDLISE
jgi:fatty-acyl-CoA synthase